MNLLPFFFFHARAMSEQVDQIKPATLLYSISTHFILLLDLIYIVVPKEDPSFMDLEKSH